MAAVVYGPPHSFVQFHTAGDVFETYGSSNPLPVAFCFPIVEFDDVAFQFIVETDTEAEADALCGVGNNSVKVGITRDDSAAWLIDYSATVPAYKPERYRIGPRRLLYNWPHGAPGFDTVIALRTCFQFAVRVTLPGGTVNFFSGCFERIAEDHFTSVVEYGSSKNAFGFLYCGYYEDDEIVDQSCPATIVPFSNVANLVVPYTAAMVTDYGDIPNAEVYLWNAGTGAFERTIVAITLDAVPATSVSFDFGGPATGYIKLF